MPSKVILILVDALNYHSAWNRCGYLGHLIEVGKGSLYRVHGELPAQSRPMYETIMTGLPASAHGVCTNAYTGTSKCENIFSLAKAHGKTTAAAAYMWMAELYNGTPPYDPRTDRFQLNNQAGNIDNGIFYHVDDYPDSHLYADGAHLLETYAPDFLLIHPMNVDDHGHKSGQGSRAYEHAVESSIVSISWYLDAWMQAGYDVVVTGDHGMDELGIHFGDSELQRDVPLFIFSDKIKPGNFSDKKISQLNVAPLLCKLLGLSASEGMIDFTKEIGEASL